MNSLSVDGLTKLVNFTTQVATITTSFSSPKIISDDIRTENLQANIVTISNLEAYSAKLLSLTLKNFNVESMIVFNKLKSCILESPTANLSDVNSTQIKTKNLIVNENIISSLITTNKTETSNINWNGKINLSNIEKFYIEVPHFENGQYYIQLMYEQNPFATIEILNSIDNYSVKWSQSLIGNIQNIFKYGEDKESKIYIEIKNTTKKALTLKYGIISSESVSYPTTCKSLEFNPTVSYKVIHKNGTKFFEHIDFQNNDLQKIFDKTHPIGELYIQYLSQKNPMDLYNKNDIYTEWINITYEYYKNPKELPYRIWKRVV